MPRLNERSLGIGFSPTMAAAAATTSHPDPIDLSVGQPSELPPSAVAEAAISAIRAGKTRYGPAAGLPALRARIGVENHVQPENVIITPGGKGALFAALQCILEPGDDVLILAPYWPTFIQQVEWCGARAVIVPHQDLRVDPIAARDACTPRTRAIIVNTPSNPTSTVIAEETVVALHELAGERDLWILSDEVYRGLTFGPPGPLPSRPDLCERARTIVVESFSKRFSMTGYRVGYAIAPPEVIEAMVRHTASSHTHASTISQHAALAALDLDERWEVERLSRYCGRASLAHERLEAMPGVTCSRPDAGFYVFPRVQALLEARRIEMDTALCEILREDIGLLLVPGTAFGAPGHVRLATCVDEARLVEALDRLGDWIGSNDASD